MAALARSKDEAVRTEVVRNPSTSSATLSSLRNDPSIEVRRGIPASSNAGADLLDHLSRDEDTQVRVGVVSNANCDSALRGEMQATDPSDDVRDAAERFQRRGKVRRS